MHLPGGRSEGELLSVNESAGATEITSKMGHPAAVSGHLHVDDRQLGGRHGLQQ